jgi:poly(3-hydroxybutyrate) depolymerase
MGLSMLRVVDVLIKSPVRWRWSVNSGRKACSDKVWFLPKYIHVMARGLHHHRIPVLTLVAALSLGSSSAWASDYLSTDCYGPPKAKTRVVYLHGWDEPDLSAHERLNRTMWQRLAASEQWRVAVPRGDGRCNGGRKQCWRTQSESDVRHSWERILVGVKQCFGEPKPFGLVGFSNGGFLLAGTYGLCLQPRPAFTIAAGSAAVGFLPPSQYKACGPLRLHSGIDDVTKKPMEAFYQSLRRTGIDVQMQTYPGGHVLHEATLIQTIQALTHSH